MSMEEIIDDYVAWARYSGGTIRLCDSDAPGAFKVYRHPQEQPDNPLRAFAGVPIKQVDAFLDNYDAARGVADMERDSERLDWLEKEHNLLAVSCEEIKVDHDGRFIGLRGVIDKMMHSQ